ncbi:MAG: S26 family signal peptidase [Candidatus Uhrbacteria bacterium]|nr:S26 family signal peptidase [Candidatus Uhrbacteria bacterium]
MVAVAVGLIAWSIESHLLITLTPSLSHRVYLMERTKEVGKNDYVVFSLKGDIVAKDNDKLLKKVSCAGGDTLKIAGKEYFCNGVSLGTAKDFSLKGNRLDNFVYEGAIGRGLLFVTGDHKDSYDSRYFGFIHKDQVTAKAYPLW